MKWVMLVVLLVSLAGPTLAATSPFSAVGTLYAKDDSGSLRMVCTASAVASDAETTTIWTAAHCISWALNRVDADSATLGKLTVSKEPWESLAAWSARLFPADSNSKFKYLQQLDFFVSFDEVKFYGAKVLVVGKESDGYDFAVLQLHEGNLPTIPVGKWQDVVNDYNANLLTGADTRVMAISNPLGLGKQVFPGSVTMLSLNRPIVDAFASINWRSNFLATIPAGPGSSGSLVLYKGKVVGVLIGVIQERFGSPFVVGTPLWKIEKSLSAQNYIVPVPPDSGQ